MGVVVVGEVFEALDAIGAIRLPHAVISLLKELPGSETDTVVLYADPVEACGEQYLFCVENGVIDTIDGGGGNMVCHPEETWWIFGRE